MSGPSGAVTYPAHITETHAEVVGYDTAGGGISESLSFDMLELINNVYLVTNPYTGVSPYDPEPHLTRIEQNVDYLEATAQGTHELVTWKAMLNKANESIDILVPTDTELDSAVASYEADQVTELAYAYNRVCAGFYDNLAVISTAFPTALAVIESQAGRNVARYRAMLETERNRDRLTAFLQSLSNMTQIMGIRLQALTNSTQLRDNYERLAIGAYGNEISQEVDMRIDEALWELRILENGSTMIGKVAGIPGMSKGMSKWQMALMTASTFASIGTGIFGAASGMGGSMMSMLPLLFL